MRYKQIMMLTIIFTCLLVVSTVSAAENATEDIISTDASEDVVSVEETSDEVVSVENDNQVITEGNDSEVGTFDDLASEISATPKGGVLNLTKDYKYVNGSNGGIRINKAITIDGKGHTLDGNQLSRVFYINAEGATLKNIKFTNAKIEDDGGAIKWYGNDGKLMNSTFSNCTIYRSKTNNAVYGGAAINWKGTNGFISDCQFINGTVVDLSPYNHGYAGAIFWEGQNGSIYNSLFLDNYAIYEGSAIKWSGADNGKLINCTFDNNHAMYGGTVYWDLSDDGLISNCNFTYNYQDGDSYDGAIAWYASNYCTISNCNFLNNSGRYAICFFDSCDYYSIDNNYLIPDENNIFAISEYIHKRNLSLKFNYASFTYNQCPNFSVELKSNYSETFSNKSIVFTFIKNGLSKIYNVTTNKEGIAILSKELTELDAGTWNVTVLFEGNDNYAPCNATATITVIPPSTSLNIDDVNGTVGHEITLIVNVNSNNLTVNEGTVSFFDGETHIGESDVFEGVATLTYTPRTAGEHTITAIYNADNYQSSNDTAKVIANPIFINVQTNMVAVGYQTTICANVNSTIVINKGKVTFFDGEIIIGESNVVNNVATLTHTPNTAGEHKIIAFYTIYDYQSPNATANLTVAKSNINLNIGYIDSVYFSYPSVITVNIKSNNNAVNEGEIKFYVNDVLVRTENVYNGVVNIDYVANTAGTLKLTVIYNETNNYFASNATTYFQVNKMPTTLTGESVIFDEEQYKTFTAELKDVNSHGVDGQTVKIEVIKYSGESSIFTGISDSNGITVYDVGDLAGGMWYIVGTYNGNGNYAGSRFTDKFIVVRMDTTTDIENDANPYVNHTYKLKANIHDESGKLVKEGIVQFYLDGVDIGSIDLSKNNGHQSGNDLLGAVSPMLYYNAGDDLLGATSPMFDDILGEDISDLYIEYTPKTAGKHILSAVYQGTSIYKSSNQTTILNVQDGAVPTKVTSSSITVVYNDGKYLVATLKDVYGNPLSGVKMSVNLNGIKTITTDKNGQIKVSTKGLTTKTYTATITFAGNKNYAKSSTTAKVVVKKATPKLTAKAKTFKKSVKTKKYAVTLKDNTGKVMKKVKLTLKIKGKTYKATTNTKGKATFKITKFTKKGTFKALVTYKGNAYYNKVTKTVKIKIK